MSDVRALLKAKREEKRVVHPFAAYNQTGQLRCTACATIVKHASAWNGHLGSKPHRTNVARLKEEERLKSIREEEQRQGKRKVDEEDGEGDYQHSENEPSKRRRIDDDDELATAPSNESAVGFPSNFFSDPSRTLPMGEVDSEEEEGGKDQPPAAATSQSQPTLDLEWAKFQEAVINAPADTDARETFERATVFAEPQLSTEIPQGFPSSLAPEPEPAPEKESAPTQKDRGEERKMREENERELIMDRLLDEERAQEEADDRVNTLKAKIDLLKQKRMAARITKPKK